MIICYVGTGGGRRRGNTEYIIHINERKKRIEKKKNTTENVTVKERKPSTLPASPYYTGHILYVQKVRSILL